MTRSFRSLCTGSLVALSLTLAPLGCTLSGVDRVSLPTCTTDEECEVLDVELDVSGDGGLRCEVHRCIDRQCALAPRDDDYDGDPLLGCEGGHDCDDKNAAVSSLATEICNGIDDDCDGALDGPDEDDDHDGQPDVCAGPAAVRDCDDTDPSTYFDAPELCDGIDNDCDIDGVLRQSGGERAVSDEDADGDRHAAVGSVVCIAGTYPLDDCDDTRADVFAGARELCDGVDNDCDGVLDDAMDSSESGTVCRAEELLAGGRNTCVYTQEGELVCWGENGLGQLGDLTAATGSVLVVRAAAGLDSVSLDYEGGCGVADDGTVTCWGGSHFFERGRSSAAPTAPGTVPGVLAASTVSVGGTHACVVHTDGTVSCWGYSCPGAYVDGVTQECGSALLPAVVAGLSDVVEVDAGGQLTCARHRDGTVSCWGFNPVGRIGTGSTDILGPVGTVTGITDAVDIEVGGFGACALRATGELLCWGYDIGCASGSCAPIATPTPIGLDGTVAQVSAGSSHVCVRYDDGRFGCWGSNTSGQLAVVDPSTSALAAPRTSALTGALDIATGYQHTCVRFAEGVRCWGANDAGELGDGRIGAATAPFAGWMGPPVSVLANAMQISIGVSATCFRLPDLRVVCTGANVYGELGSGGAPSGVPSLALDGAQLLDVALASGHSAVLSLDHHVYGRGETRYGAVGTANESGALLESADGAPVSDAIDVAVSSRHTCFVRSSGAVSCFGMSTYGMLGNAGVAPDACAYDTCSLTPVNVLGLPHEGDDESAPLLDPAVAIETGASHTCARTASGDVYCWGRNDQGQTGTLPLGETTTAVRVEGLPAGDPVVDLALGGASSCALTATGAVWCWGATFGETGYSVDPLPLVGAANVVQIAATDGGLCVRQRSGALRCVGANASGQLGAGDTTSSTTLRVVLGISDARDLGCGAVSCCATRTSGQTLCWGDNTASQLGVGDTTNRTRPTSVASMLWSL